MATAQERIRNGLVSILGDDPVNEFGSVEAVHSWILENGPTIKAALDEKRDHESRIVRIDIREFRVHGYLQELNRRFLHPLGLALETEIEEELGYECLGGIWDYRDDPEGMNYGWSEADELRETFDKARCISETWRSRRKARELGVGYMVQPVPEFRDEPLV